MLLEILFLLVVLNSTYSGGEYNGDGFLAKFSADGYLLFSTYVGGSGDDLISSVVLDASGNIILEGGTLSHNFPILNAYDSTYGGGDDHGLVIPYIGDGFLAKFSTDGQLLFSTYVGGSGDDSISSVVVDHFGNIILAGGTTSADFPTLNAYDSTFGGGDADSFLVIFSADGQLLFSTYVGGSGDDWISSVVLDASGNIILAGGTSSADFPILNAYDSIFGGGDRDDGFLMKFGSLDGDADFMVDIWEEEYGLDTSINDAQQDLDGDGIPNLWEFQNGLIPNIDDALEDKDQDGLTNILEYSLGSSVNNNDTDYDGIPDGYEYFMGLNLTKNDAMLDNDNDGMPNLWEYHNDLNASVNDAYLDHDGDWVANIIEYHSNTSAIDFWDFPLLYSEFPFMISPVTLVILFSVGGIVMGLIASYQFKNMRRRRLMIQMGAPDYATVVKMKQGKFSDHEIYQKALAQNITDMEEYEFMNEIKNEKNTE
ncbi:MAG: SBBP repeat-containing protein [Candidatus Hodarchaeales archaeon]|jgi:hypothetical protein